MTRIGKYSFGIVATCIGMAAIKGGYFQDAMPSVLVPAGVSAVLHFINKLNGNKLIHAEIDELSTRRALGKRTSTNPGI